MKKRGLIYLVLLIALSIMGAAFAFWSQILTANNTVATGTYDVVFSSFTAPANGGYQDTFTAAPVNPHEYVVGLNNLYPGRDAIFTFTLEDTGTVSAKISDIKLDGISVAGTGYAENKDMYPQDGTMDITVSVLDVTVNEQINAGGTITGHLKVHTWGKVSSDTNDASPSCSGSFTFEIDAVQYPQ